VLREIEIEAEVTQNSADAQIAPNSFRSPRCVRPASAKRQRGVPAGSGLHDRSCAADFCTGSGFSGYA